MAVYARGDRHPGSTSWATKVSSIFACLTLMLLGSMPITSAETPKDAQTPKGDEHTTIGPANVRLGDMLANLELPKGYAFVDKSVAESFLKSQGSSVDGILGMIGPVDDKGKDGSFVVICRFEDVGYVNDDDANKINANDILNAYKDGTRDQNEERKELNLPPIFVGGWAEQPHYVKDKHQVIWAIEVKDEEREGAPVMDINYNTRILGRRGVLSLNLVTSPHELETNKKKVAELLNATTFVKTQTYADYNPKTDKKAEFGIAGLILGGGAMAAAAKFGVFGALGKWIIGLVLVFKKFAIVAIAGIGALIAKLFGGKKKDDQV